jgi:hypothetical protein
LIGFRKFDFAAGMQEAPEDLKFLLEDLEAIPWRRRKWERQGVLRMLIERTSNDKWLKFHDEQAKLLSSLQRGPRKSFLGNLGESEQVLGEDQVLSFSRTFFLRLMIATSVTLACLNSVLHVRISLNAFGPPDSCNPFDPKYSPCNCKHVVERCTYRFDQCISICDAAANTSHWQELLRGKKHPDGLWDNEREGNAWVETPAGEPECLKGPGAHLGPDKNRPKCVAYQYFKNRGGRDWCLRIQELVKVKEGEGAAALGNLTEHVNLSTCVLNSDDQSQWTVLG